MCVASFVSMSAIQILTWLFVLQKLRIRKDKVDNSRLFDSFSDCVPDCWRLLCWFLFSWTGLMNYQMLIQRPRFGTVSFNWSSKSPSSNADQAFEKIQEKTFLGRLGGSQIHPSQCCQARQGRFSFRTDITRPDHVEIWWPSNFNYWGWSTLESGVQSLLH